MENLKNFLEYVIQDEIEKAEYHFLKPSPEETPFDNKYKSREILECLLKNPIFIEEFAFSRDLKAVSAYIHYLLGLNFLETEEISFGEKTLKKSLQEFYTLDDDVIEGFYNVIQDLYNNLGFIYINREEMELGMGCLAKAEELYEAIKDIEEYNYMSLRVYFQNRIKYPQEKSHFRYYYSPGLNKRKTEGFYTLTQFYLAQSYTKFEMKEKAAYYCGNTMKRQFETCEFQIREWCINAISLAEYYQNNHGYAQGFYLLQAGNCLIPPDKRKKLRATFQMSMARLFLDYLKYMINILNEDIPKDLQIIIGIINKKHLIFESINAQFVELEIPKDYEGIAKLYRLANTQYKKALAFFVLDGYVTEHIEMTFEMTQMMKYMGLMEKDPNRNLALLEKRKDLLEPIQKELNPKAYPGFIQRILVELSEIYNEMFENRFQELFIKSTTKPKKPKVEQMNKYGLLAIKTYEAIENILLEQIKEQKDQPKEHYQSIINTRFNVAKAYNKIYAVDKREKIDYMKKSLENYRFIVEFIKELLKNKGNLEWDFSEQLKICQEMVELIPSKIDKINSET